MDVLNILMSDVERESRAYLQEVTATSEDESDEAAPKAPMATDIEIDGVVSREEQILTLLNDSGGRMWQQDILAETGYSAGTVSRLLSEMEEDGQITRYWKNGAKVVADPELLPPALTE